MPDQIRDYSLMKGSIVVDHASGFKAATYSHPDGSRLLVFAGTDTEYGGIQLTLDAMDSAVAALTGGFTLQAEQADAYTQTWANGSSTLVGHSLGGGLAAWAGIGTEHTVVAINARGLGLMTGMFSDTSNVYHYYSLSDPLTYGNWAGNLYRWGNEVTIDSDGHSSRSACNAMGGSC